MIRVARLSLWSRILCKAPVVLKSLCSDMANAMIGWPVAVLDDLHWSCGGEKHAAFSNRSYEDWAAAVRDNSKQFKGVVLKSTLSLDSPIFIARRRGPQAFPSSHLPFLFVEGRSAPLCKLQATAGFECFRSP